MKLKGFTLAEVLVTLTLIGIVATLTLPALMTNIQRQQAGPALMRAIATLDTANALLFAEQDTLTFSEACPNYKDCFDRFIRQRIGADNGGLSRAYDDFPGSEWTNSSNPLTNGYTTKNGFIYYIDRSSFSGGRVDVYIDVNGLRGPNMYCKDVFRVRVSDEDGKVYAEGSKANPWGNAGDWENGGADSTGVREGRACAGSIVDNGGRVIYPW